MKYHDQRLFEAQIRFADVAPQSYDKKARTVTAVISVGSPVQRFYGVERLAISKEAVDFSRLHSAGIPVLDSHNQRGLDNHLGRYSRIWFGTEKGKPALLGEIRFNDTERGRMAEGMVARGEIAGISAGYVVKDWTITDGDGKVLDPEKTRINFDDDLTFTASRWELLEASLVTVPADSESYCRSFGSGHDRACPSWATPADAAIGRMHARMDRGAAARDARARMLARQKNVRPDEKPAMTISNSGSDVGRTSSSARAGNGGKVISTSPASDLLAHSGHQGGSASLTLDVPASAQRGIASPSAPESAPSPPLFPAATVARSQEDDARLCYHEAAHAVLQRLLTGRAIGGVSVRSGPDFDGLCWGPKHDRERSYAFGSSDTDTDAILDTIASTVPPLAAPLDVPDLYAETFSRTIEALAGFEGERLFMPGRECPASSASDLHLARGLASLICSSAESIDRFIEFARAEAASLLRRHAHIVQAIAHELGIKRELTGPEVDDCIAGAVAAKALTEEKTKREEMRMLADRVAANAGLFEPIMKR